MSFFTPSLSGVFDGPYQICSIIFSVFGFAFCFQVETGKDWMWTNILAALWIVLPTVLEPESPLLKSWHNYLVSLKYHCTWLAFGSGPWSQPCPYSWSSIALKEAGWRSPEHSQHVSQWLLSVDNHTADTQTHSWPSCIWQVGTVFDSSSADALRLMWFVSGALILKISLIM